MNVLLLVFTITVSVCMTSVPTVSALTNAEFYDLIKDYVTDVEVIETDDEELDFIGQEINDDINDVIELPGEADDELDVEYLIEKLGLTQHEETHQVGWFHKKHHHHNHHHKTFSCHCHHDSCNCCLKHTFRVNLIFKKFRFRLHACVTAAYLRSNIGFEITFTINGHRLFHKEISLKHPPPLCFGVPGLKRFARICLEFYDINLRTKHLCARITGVLDIMFKKFKVHLKLGCFKIPIIDEQALTSLLNDRDFLNVDMHASDDTGEVIETRDWVELFRQLQQTVDNEEDVSQ